MQIRKGDAVYACSEADIRVSRGTKHIIFSITDGASPEDVKALFGDGDFYFYDDVLEGVLPFFSGYTLTGVNIKYLADLTCNVVLKLTKGDVDDESNV